MQPILNHIAIPVRFPDDQHGFYTGILGFTEKYRFAVEAVVALKIFGIDADLHVTLMERDGLKLELFHSTDEFNPGVAHICLNMPDLNDVCRLAGESGYTVVLLERPSGKLAFITDSTGNRFEIKEVQEM